MASVTWTQWWDRALSLAQHGSAMAACPDLPQELVTTQQRTVSLHLSTLAARLAVDPEVRRLEHGPRFRLGQGMEVRCVRVPNPVRRNILGGLHFMRGEGADVWAAVQRQLPGVWHKSLRPPGHERLVGVEWRVWAANGPCP